MKTFEYLVLRYVHDMAIDEFANIGVFMLNKSDGQFYFRLNDRYGRISKFFNGFDGDHYRDSVKQLGNSYRLIADRIRKGDLFEASPSSIESVVTRVVNGDASCFQWSTVRSGITSSPRRKIDRLFEEYVTYHEQRSGRNARDESVIWTELKKILLSAGISSRVENKVELEAANYSYPFKLGWQNGTRQVLEPISFDLLRPASILEKANTWGGRLYTLSKENDFQFTAVVAKPQSESEMGAFEDGCAILESSKSVRGVVPEEQFDDFVPEIENDLEGR